MTICCVCGKSVDRRSDMNPEVIGFQSKRKQGGLNTLIGKRETGRVACSMCITGIKHGIKVGVQEELF